MKLGVINNESWAFFHEIYAEFERHHETTRYRSPRLNSPVFNERLNRMAESRWLKAFLRDHDVVFFEWASEALAQASHLPKTCGIVTRLHRYELYQWAHHIRWEAVDRVILVSQAKKREFVHLFPGQSSKVVVVPEAISLDRFSHEHKEYQRDLGILCHLSPRKRVYELILTLQELLDRGGSYRLHIGGAGHSRFPDYEPSVRGLVQRLGLDQQVKFYGEIEDPATWYRNVDIFVSNSYSEGLQVSPMEAIASGCYCLSHWWEGADELLSEADLFFTDAQLVEKIEAFDRLSTQHKRERQNRQREDIASRFNIEQIQRRIRAVVEQVDEMTSMKAGA